MTPRCFQSDAAYEEWKRLAIAAKEEVCVCDDCTDEFSAVMQAHDKCHKQQWQGVVFHRGLVKPEITTKQVIIQFGVSA